MASSDITNTTNNEQLLNMAIETAKSGQREGARVMFMQVWEANKRNEEAMLWLAKIARDEQERRKWLERVVQINENNVTAKKALAKMNRTQEASDNQMLLLFGAAAIIMLVIVVAIVLLVVL